MRFSRNTFFQNDWHFKNKSYQINSRKFILYFIIDGDMEAFFLIWKFYIFSAKNNWAETCDISGEQLFFRRVISKTIQNMQNNDFSDKKHS